jgi:VIT1/CCC1 family predicted Fe2+/Mn2+ transporter
MFDTVLFYRTPIATVLGVAVAVAVFFTIDIRWYLAAPVAFAAMMATALIWGILLGVIERVRS